MPDVGEFENPLKAYYEILVVRFGIAPSEFWKMSPTEVRVFLKTKAEENKPSGLGDDQLTQIENHKEKLQSQGVNVL